MSKEPKVAGDEMVATPVRATRNEKGLWQAKAKEMGESLSSFLRLAANSAVSDNSSIVLGTRNIEVPPDGWRSPEEVEELIRVATEKGIAMAARSIATITKPLPPKRERTDDVQTYFKKGKEKK
jgi:hypothetical protein